MNFLIRLYITSVKYRQSIIQKFGDHDANSDLFIEFVTPETVSIHTEHKKIG